MKSHVQLALSYYGLTEIYGAKNNPVIMEFFNYIGHGYIQGDETAWCACFVNYILKRSGLRYSGKLNARSFLEIGKSTKTPVIGDIVVFWRESKDSWKGHVGFYIGEDKENIFCLGGNQNNQVNISSYSKNRVLSFQKID